MGIVTILWEKWREFRRDFYKITLAAMVAPLMYLIVFGFGIQTMSHGEPYLNFLIPGVVALTTMNGSFNAIAQNLNVQRLYEKAFDQVMISPTPLWQFIVGQILGGSLRGLYAGCIILLLASPVATGLVFNGFPFFGNAVEWSSVFCHRSGSVFWLRIMRMFRDFRTMLSCLWHICATHFFPWKKCRRNPANR